MAINMNSLIKDFNDKYRAEGISFSSVLEGKFDITSETRLAQEVLGDISGIFKDGDKTDSYLFQASMNREKLRQSGDSSVMTPEEFRRYKGTKIQKQSIENNIRTIESFIKTVESPTVFSSMGAEKSDFFTPYKKPTTGAPIYSNKAKIERIHSVTGRASKIGNKSIEKTNDILEAFDNSRTRSKKGIFNLQGGTIWSSINHTSDSSAYSKQSMSTQKTIEDYNLFNTKLSGNRAPHNGFVTFDIETFGNMNGDMFQINEIALQKWKKKKDGGGFEEGKVNSWLLKPTSKTEEKLLSTINMLEANPHMFSSLSDDMQRSITDLMKYSTSEVGGAKSARFIKDLDSVHVVHNNIQDARGIYNGKKINKAEIIENIDMHITHMKSGLKNLTTEGSDSKEVMKKYSDYVNNNRSQFFASYNGESFDLPGLEKFGKDINVDVKSPKHHIDWFNVLRSTLYDPSDIHEMIKPGEKRTFKKGPQTLEEIARTLFSSNKEYLSLSDQAHVASFDIGKFGLGGIINETNKLIGNVIDAGKMNEAPGDPFRSKSSNLEYSEQPLKKGQRFFAIGGTKNFKEGTNDVQIEYVNGERTIRNYGSNVFNARSEYELTDIRKVNKEERYIAQFTNLDDGTVTLIDRAGKDARHEISQAISQHLELADNMADGLSEGISRVRKRDAARRHYDQLFGTSQGLTRGFDAAERMMANVAKVNELYQGPLEDMTDSVRKEITNQLNFNSLPKGKINTTEIDKFWTMLPRLQSEAPFYSEFINEIKSAIPDIPGKPQFSEQRMLNLKRSLLLKQMTESLNYEVGGAPMEERTALPHEQRKLRYTNRADGKQRTIDLTSAKSAHSSISRTLFGEDAKEREGKYLTTIASLQESGYMTKDQASAFVEDYHASEGMTPHTHAKKLAAQLAENEAVVGYVASQNKTITSPAMSHRPELQKVRQEKVKEIINKTLQTKDGLFTTPGKVPQSIINVFEELDKPHSMTGLKPENQKALSGFLERLMGVDYMQTMGTAITMSEDNKSVFVNVFSEFESERVLGELGNPSRNPNTPINGMLRFELPVLDSDGTIRYNGQYQNARTMIGKGRRVLNSQDRFYESYTEGKLKSIIGRFTSQDEKDKEGAQRYIERIARGTTSDLSGLNGNFVGENDSYVYKNSPADIAKQSHVEVHGLVHELYEKDAEFKKYGLMDSAFVIDREGKTTTELKEFIPSNSLTPKGLSILELQEATYAEEVLGRPVYKTPVKSDASPMTVGTVNVSELKDYGALSPATRDNPLQLLNSYAYDEAMQESLSSAGTNKLSTDELKPFVSFNQVITTDAKDELYQRMGGNGTYTMDVKTIWMTDPEVVNRIEEMKSDERQRNLLLREGIIDENGEYNKARLPQVYEQGMILDDAIQERLMMKKAKYIEISDNLQIADDLMDESTGKVKVGSHVTPGQIIAGMYDHEGNLVKGSEVRYEGKSEGRVIFDDGRVGIEYTERAHKVQLDYEKGTFSGGGLRGYSSEFMKEFTGQEGIGAIQGPDVIKHQDHDSIVGGRVRQMLYAINEAEGEEKERLLSIAKKYELGGELEIRNGQHILRESLNKGQLATFDMGAIKEMIREADLNENYFIQQMSISNVELYGGIAGENGGQTSYGPRELQMLKNNEMNATYEYVSNEIREKSIRSGADSQLKGMAVAQISMTDGVDMEKIEGKIWKATDFEDVSDLDSNKYLNRNTVIDTDRIREENRYSKILSNQHGFVLELPQYEGLQINSVSGKPLSHIVLPYAEFDERLQERGETMYKSKIQKLNSDIIKSAKEIEAIKTDEPGAATRARRVAEEMQNLESHIRQANQTYVQELGTSQGFASRHGLKEKMSNSAAGLTKIMSPEWMDKLGGEEFTMMSMEDASKMSVNRDFAIEFGVEDNKKRYTMKDVLEHTEKSGKDFYVQSTRYPIFHDDAGQPTKLKMSADLAPNHQMIDAVTAKWLRADSDGDMNNILAATDMNVQQEMSEEVSKRKVRNHEVLEKMLSEKETSVDKWLEEGYGRNEDGVVKVYDNTNFDTRYVETQAKNAKQLVGYASNMGYRYNQLAESYFDKNTEEGLRKINEVKNFFSGPQGLEQRIISAKHNNSDVVLRLNASQQFMEALSFGNWNRATEIDLDHMGGFFSDEKKANMSKAFAHIREMQANLSPEEFKNKGLNMGLRTLGLTEQEMADELRGKGSFYNENNEHFNQLHDRISGHRPVPSMEGAMGTPGAATESSTSSAINSAEELTSPKNYHTSNRDAAAVIDELSVNRTSPAREALEAAERGRMGIGGKFAIGAAAVAGVGMIGMSLTNTTRAINHFEGDAPSAESADGYYQSSPDSPQMTPVNNARVELNGTGLSGLNVKVQGIANQSMSNDQIQSIIGSALSSSGIDANINVNMQNDTSGVSREWMQDQFSQLISNGRV